MKVTLAFVLNDLCNKLRLLWLSVSLFRPPVKSTKSAMRYHKNCPGTEFARSLPANYYYVVKQLVLLRGASGDFWWKSSRKAWYRPQRLLDHAANWIVSASPRQRYTKSATTIRRCLTGTRSWLQGGSALMSSSGRAVESSRFPSYTTAWVAPAGSYPKLGHR
jgi:hypothetical protein